MIEIEKTEKLARYRAEAEAMPMRDLQRALSEMDVDCRYGCIRCVLYIACDISLRVVCRTLHFVA